MAEALSFIYPREKSCELHSSFNFSSLNRNLLNEFNEPETTILSTKNDQLPVYLRIRPLNPDEPLDKVLSVRNASKVVYKPPIMEKNLRPSVLAFGQTSHEFTFSRIFDESTQQIEIYKTIMKDRVVEFLEGVNGLVFAYGTTSSGKTYSLQGSEPMLFHII